MANVPSNLIPARISQLPEAPVADPAGYFPIVISGTTYKVQFSQINQNLTVPPSRAINAGTGLTGGGTLSHDITIAVANGGIGDSQLDTTGVSAGTYGDGANVPVVTVNTKGRVTSLSTTPLVVSGYVPDSRQVIAGSGLTGGGTLAADRTLAINFSSATPQPLGSPTAGTGTNAARDDHVHPAVDLSDGTETSGVLPMGRGGTGANMSPVAGAIVFSNGSNFDLTTVGSTGQVLLAAGASAPVWGDAASFTVDAADRLLGGAANRVVYQAGTSDTSFVVAPALADTFLKWNGSSFEWGAVAGAGTVTSVQGSGGTTGLTVSGGPITTVGTLTLGGTLSISAGGTGLSGTPTNGQLLIGNGSGYSLASLTAGTAISVTNATGSISIANTAPDQTITLTDGTAIDVTGTYPSFTITNTAPDQTVVISASTAISVSGTYPSFTITNTAPDQTVTITAGTNISTSGTYPSFTVSSPDTVVGPAGATSGAISLFDGGTGKLLKNSVITINASGVISNVNTPNTGTDAANKQYVDDLVSTGIHIHTPVVLATSPGSSRTDTYNNGTAGVSATLTSVAAGTLVIDGTVASATIRVLIQDCSNPIGNGVYVVTNPGSAVAQYIMTRSSDADTSGQQSTQSLDDGSYFFTTGGTSNKGAAWVNTNSGTISFGSTAITFAQFSSSQVYSAGNGLSLTATTFSLETPVTVLNGGTGQSSAPTNGQLLIGNGAGYNLSTLTAGSNLSVTNATGSITLAVLSDVSFNSASITTLSSGSLTATNLTATSGTVTTLASTSAAITNLSVTSLTVSSLSLANATFTSATITTLTSTSAEITTLSGTTLSYGSSSITNLSLGSLVISSTTLVANLNADLLDGQTGSYYLDLANATGTLSGGAY
jgi:hypothetical protein